MKFQVEPASSLLVLLACLTVHGGSPLPAQARVKDLDGGISSSPSGFVEWRGTTYFQALDSSTGPFTLRRRLWRTDGTAAGTLALPAGPTGWRFVDELTPAPTLLFFTATDTVSGTELWATDGSAAGTQMVADIGPGAHSGGVRDLCAVGDTLFFVANTVEQTPFGPRYDDNPELWRTDGSPAGTRLVVDLSPGWSAPPSQIRELMEFQGLLYFVANPTGQSAGLWRSDGTAAGTREVPYAKTGGNPAIALLRGNDAALYFLDNGDLWTSQGTTATTVRLATGSFTELVLAERKVFLRAGDTLFCWNGAQAVALTTLRVLDWIQPAGSSVYFRGDNGFQGREPWTSDGTVAGTRMVVDLFVGSQSGMDAPDRYATPHYFEPIGTRGDVVFVGNDGVGGLQLHRTDGTVLGTRRLTNLTYAQPFHGPNDFHQHGSQVFFRCHDAAGDMELWSMPVGRTEFAVAEPFGLGCPGASSTTPPRIGVQGTPTLGSTNFGTLIDGAAPGAPAVLMLGVERSPLAWLGCQLAVQPVLFGPWTVVNAAGRAVVPIAVPSTPVLLGSSATLQWGVLQPQGGFLGVASLSDGLFVVVGR